MCVSPHTHTHTYKQTNRWSTFCRNSIFVEFTEERSDSYNNNNRHYGNNGDDDDYDDDDCSDDIV